MMLTQIKNYRHSASYCFRFFRFHVQFNDNDNDNEFDLLRFITEANVGVPHSEIDIIEFKHELNLISPFPWEQTTIKRCPKWNGNLCGVYYIVY